MSDVAGDVDRLRTYDAAQRYAGYLRRAAADVDYEVALGRLDVETGTQCRRHGLEYEVDLAAARMLCRVAHGAYLDVGRARRDADHHAQRRREESAGRMHLLYQTAEHQLGGVEVGDHTVFKRSYSLDVGVGLLVHLARLVAYGDHFARMLFERDDRRLVDHNLAVVHYQRIGRTQIDGQLLCQRKKAHSELSLFDCRHDPNAARQHSMIRRGAPAAVPKTSL